MTRRRPLSFRRRRANLAFLVTVVFAFAWILRLWLLVLGCVAGAVAVLRSQLRYQRTILPAIIAGTAVIRAPGVAASTAVEDWAAMWLAVTSGGRAERLRRAAQLVARTEGDPWAARVTIMRLEAAEQTLTQGRVLGLSSRGRIDPGWRAGMWGVLAGALLTLAHTDGIWWLAPTAWALAGTSSALTEFQESRTAPHLLASEALLAPPRWGDRAASRLELALLARGDARVLRQSRQLVETATWDLPNRRTALRELAAAEAMVRATRSG
jgi:hypothetical protein